ncbi:fibrinogen C domain-containing protein 1-like [Musca vetustissima]|uniref:fibrinogen C domain-containing protein 1-like n=1 Tax=Musca vetustissima TaxID=27455 RepID=UPI002AB70297|nr:fibrinogen C domain-containing protein 1-like [Musca vetustissima]
MGPSLIYVTLIFFNIFNGSKTQIIPTDVCDSEDLDAWIQWYSDVYKFAKTNKDVYKHLHELEAQLQTIKSQLSEVNSKLDQLQENIHGEIIIQRRMDGSEDFYRPWEDYKRGFGNKSGEFFIGLERLHKLTNSRPYELLVVLEDFDNDRRYAKYDNFVVASEKEKYKLQSLGQYNGTAGDSLTWQLGQKFTTKDQDNDTDNNNNCAQLYTGAWWYRSCHASNLNGSYLKGATTVYAKGVVWQSFRGHYYSLKFVEMSIRPK